MYNFELETAGELATILARNVQQRRLEKGLSRAALSRICDVPTPTIAKFEQSHTISLHSFLAIAKALGYINDIKSLLSKPNYNSIEELDLIKKNRYRKRGRDESSR